VQLADRRATDDEFTTLLAAVREGDQDAFRLLYERLYAELRRLAHSVRAGYGAETVNTTALVHEAYLKLAPSGALDARDRAHFLRIAARAMRQVLIDAARRRQTRAKHEPDLVAYVAEDSGDISCDVVALDRALVTLERINPRQASVVECRFFAGLSVEETAEALAVSPPTVKRDWRIARAWLAHALGAAGGSGSEPPAGGMPR